MEGWGRPVYPAEVKGAEEGKNMMFCKNGDQQGGGEGGVILQGGASGRRSEGGDAVKVKAIRTHLLV